MTPGSIRIRIRNPARLHVCSSLTNLCIERRSWIDIELFRYRIIILLDFNDLQVSMPRTQPLASPSLPGSYSSSWTGSGIFFIFLIFVMSFFSLLIIWIIFFTVLSWHGFFSFFFSFLMFLFCFHVDLNYFLP